MMLGKMMSRIAGGISCSLGAQPRNGTDQAAGRPAEDWMPVMWPDLEAAIPPRSFWTGPADPVCHFLRWVYEYRAYLTLLCDISRTSAVLELGCNHGRTMLGLLDYLQPPGRYEGLDIMRRHVEWAQAHIQADRPHFRFTHANIHNTAYNPGGTIAAREYVFPYPDQSFDAIYAASLFTHLVPDSARRYLAESARVIRPGGRCLFSFFVLDHYHGPSSTTCDLYTFEHRYDNDPEVAVYSPANPEAVIAFRLSAIERMAEAAGLVVERVLPGFWCSDQKRPINEQDLVLFRRPE